MSHEVDRFVAVADDGREVTIVVLQDEMPAPSHDDPHGSIGGMKEAFTLGGEPCRRIDDQTFEVPSIGVVHRKH